VYIVVESMVDVVLVRKLGEDELRFER
jgi:hypothetical protein